MNSHTPQKIGLTALVKKLNLALGKKPILIHDIGYSHGRSSIHVFARLPSSLEKNIPAKKDKTAYKEYQQDPDHHDFYSTSGHEYFEKPTFVEGYHAFVFARFGERYNYDELEHRLFFGDLDPQAKTNSLLLPITKGYTVYIVPPDPFYREFGHLRFNPLGDLCKQGEKFVCVRDKPKERRDPLQGVHKFLNKHVKKFSLKK